MPLDEYQRKRNLSKTPEPAGGKASDNKLHFVVQKHNASHLHYDFRLEAKGVLLSWAVPKGPSLDPAVERMAVMVEDHPYDYKDFEGNIPAGNYGAGSVIIWDEGVYEPVQKKKSKQEQENHIKGSSYKGQIDIVLKGKKLKGHFRLLKKRGSERDWLLIKMPDKYASAKDVLKKDKSVRSGLTVEEMAGNKMAETWHSNRNPAAPETSLVQLVKQGRAAPPPRQIEPMLCTLIDKPFHDDDWLYELKLDGYRIISIINKQDVLLSSRNRQSYTSKYKIVAEALQQLNVHAILDGEIVVLNEQGHPDFSLLQNYKGTGNIVYYVFDVLWIEGYDMTQLPLVKRKEVLQKLVSGASVVKYLEHFDNGHNFYAAVRANNLEGLVAKHKQSSYAAATRSRSWLKLPVDENKEYIIIGYTESEHNRLFSRLLFGEYRGNKLYHVHHTGGGMSDKMMKEVFRKLKPLEVKKKPVVNEVEDEDTAIHWVKPELVGVFKQKKMQPTRSGKIRHPVIFVGLREDKEAKQVQVEETVATSTVVTKQRKTTARNANEKKPVDEVRVYRKLHPGERITSKELLMVEGKNFTIINNEKEYWPKVTKASLLLYYSKVFDYLQPYLLDRPLGLNIALSWAGDTEFIRNMKGNYPEWIDTYTTERRVTARNKSSQIDWLICNDMATLFYMLNLGAVDFHPWAARISSADNPDYIVIDLDVDDEEQEFGDLVATAKAAKEFFNKQKLLCFIKTSGKKGLHLLLPCSQITYNESPVIAAKICDAIHELVPSITTRSASVNSRNGLLYIDASQNNYSDRLVAPYCVRSYKIPSVSTPLEWSELNKGFNPKNYNMLNMMQRLEQKGDLFEGLLSPENQHKNDRALRKFLN